jgi:Flp pilus assembly protein TadG
MRRLNGEDGSIAITVGVIFMGLVAILALTVDAGILHNEREELQNGADAAALAVAYSCARGSCNTALAAEYATANARTGGTTSVQSVTVNSTAKTVEVVTVTPDTPMEAGRTFGRDTVLVRARGRAKWGVVGAAATAPFVISDCEVDKGLAAQGGSLYTTVPAGTGTIITFHDSTSTNEEFIPTCDTGPAGADLPGGFGKIEVDASCKVTTTTDATTGDVWASVVTGTSMPPAYRCLQLGPMAIPVFGEFRGTGTMGEYRITSYIGFHVTGWSFPGYSTNPPACKNALASELGIPIKDITGQAYCVSGYFINYTIADGAFCTSTTSCPLGVTTARMTY